MNSESVIGASVGSAKRVSEQRRKLLKAVGVAGLAASLPQMSRAQVAGNSTLKVALVGCGGRGVGAAVQTLNNQGTQLVALADAFDDQAQRARSTISERFSSKEKFDVPDEHVFSGFDGYRQAIDLADVVILATPPGFRPAHFEYCVQKGKHVFMEKPVAVDGPGVRKVLEAAKVADQKKLKVVVGLQRRYDANYRAAKQKVEEGGIGRLISAQCYWNSAGVWVKQRQANQSEMEYQMRNWYYFNWLCGDHIAEQHIHNIDVVNWFKDGFPVKAQGMGGRQVRIGKDFGEIFDHHFVEFTYEDGFICSSQCRHQPGTLARVSEVIQGSAGIVYPNSNGSVIQSYDGKRERLKEKGINSYQFEHDELYRHIRADKPLNDAYIGAKSTLVTVMGRMATYSGQEVSWDQAMNSKLDLTPERLAWDADPGPKPGADGLYPCAIPGETKVI